MKATLVLLPLLGITYMLFFVNPGEDDLSQIVFIYFNSFLQSFQVGCVTRGGHGELCCPGMLRGSCPHMRFPCVRPHVQACAHPVTPHPRAQVARPLTGSGSP